MTYKNFWTEVPGWETEKEQDCLLKYSKQVPEEGKILEIGSEFGMSASLFRFGSHGSVFITCVEIDPNAPFQKNLAAKGLWFGIKAHIVSSNEFYGYHVGYWRGLGQSIEQFDLIFVDGDHSVDGAYLDIHECFKMLKPGGFMLLHDVAVETNTNPHEQHFWVKEAYDIWASEQLADTFIQVETVDSVVVIQKI